MVLAWFTVLGLKDAIFCLPLSPKSQLLFAFEWEGRRTQFKWTVFPQWFKNSPNVIGNQLTKDLVQWECPSGKGILLQYQDDILMATETERLSCDKRAYETPTLGLPDITKSFWLFSYEKQGIALEVLAQSPGSYQRAVAYFSRQLDEVSRGWPSCLREVAVLLLNIQEVHKFTLGQRITVLISHAVSAVLEVKGSKRALALTTEVPQVSGYPGRAG